jgi:hypothetical protein
VIGTTVTEYLVALLSPLRATDKVFTLAVTDFLPGALSVTW